MSKFFASKQSYEAEELLRDSEMANCTPIASAVRGELVTLSGTVRSLTLRPNTRVPAVEADLYDGSGHVTVVFLGRRKIAGIEPGRTMKVTGRLTCHTDTPTIYNPFYELRPKHGAHG